LAKLIVVVGYSFSDSHINKMLAQALRNDEECRLLVGIRCDFKKDVDAKCEAIARKLEVQANRIVSHFGSAKDFLANSDLSNIVRSSVPEPRGNPF
jgi:hypothetical protein